MAELAEAIGAAESHLKLLRAELDPAVAEDLERRLGIVRRELDWLRGIRSAGAADETAPFWRKFVQSGESGAIVSP
ncbi:MAG: hypothetical protein ACREBM_05550 [Sphingomicrobium sp.]